MKKIVSFLFNLNLNSIWPSNYYYYFRTSGEKNIKCVSPTWFKCKDGQCLSSLLYCNGEYDCEDHSDEPENCTADGHSDEFKCKPHENFLL